jgi:Domain of unknown function (DUF4410)
MMCVLRRLDVVSVFCLSALVIAGCAKATVTPTRPAATSLPRPDRIIVHDFAVTPADVALDRGLGPRVMRDTAAASQTDEEVRIGQAVSKALTDNLVSKLREQGINAQRAIEAAPPGPTTASVVGHFLSVDQGDRTMRTLIGFGLGSSEVRTRVQVYQGAGPNARLVGEAETNTRGGLKPGMGVMLPIGAAAGTVATTAVIAGGTTITSEAFFATVEADARRTAEAVAKRIVGYYRERGWTSQ